MACTPVAQIFITAHKRSGGCARFRGVLALVATQLWRKTRVRPARCRNQQPAAEVRHWETIYPALAERKRANRRGKVYRFRAGRRGVEVRQRCTNRISCATWAMGDGMEAKHASSGRTKPDKTGAILSRGNRYTLNLETCPVSSRSPSRYLIIVRALLIWSEGAALGWSVSQGRQTSGLRPRPSKRSPAHVR